MSNTLEINLEETNNSYELQKTVNVFDSEDIRKEIYVKILCLKSLSRFFNENDIAHSIDSSLFYNKIFYEKTGIIDFYVNDNLFDLIIIDKTSKKPLFKLAESQIRSDVSNYVFIQAGNDFSDLEILGFCQRDIIAHVLTEKLMSPELLEPIINIGKIESNSLQFNIEEIEEQFFELLSNYLDNNFDENLFGELASILYHSENAREIFKDTNKIEEIGKQLEKDENYFKNYFLPIITGTHAEELVDVTEITINTKEGSQYSEETENKSIPSDVFDEFTRQIPNIIEETVTETVEEEISELEPIDDVLVIEELEPVKDYNIDGIDSIEEYDEAPSKDSQPSKGIDTGGIIKAAAFGVAAAGTAALGAAAINNTLTGTSLKAGEIVTSTLASSIKGLAGNTDKPIQLNSNELSNDLAQNETIKTEQYEQATTDDIEVNESTEETSDYIKEFFEENEEIVEEEINEIEVDETVEELIDEIEADESIEETNDDIEELFEENKEIVEEEINEIEIDETVEELIDEIEADESIEETNDEATEENSEEPILYEEIETLEADTLEDLDFEIEDINDSTNNEPTKTIEENIVEEPKEIEEAEINQNIGDEEIISEELAAPMGEEKEDYAAITINEENTDENSTSEETENEKNTEHENNVDYITLDFEENENPSENLSENVPTKEPVENSAETITIETENEEPLQEINDEIKDIANSEVQADTEATIEATDKAPEIEANNSETEKETVAKKENEDNQQILSEEDLDEIFKMVETKHNEDNESQIELNDELRNILDTSEIPDGVSMSDDEMMKILDIKPEDISSQQTKTQGEYIDTLKQEAPESAISNETRPITEGKDDKVIKMLFDDQNRIKGEAFNDEAIMDFDIPQEKPKMTKKTKMIIAANIAAIFVISTIAIWNISTKTTDKLVENSPYNPQVNEQMPNNPNIPPTMDPNLGPIPGETSQPQQGSEVIPVDQQSEISSSIVDDIKTGGTPIMIGDLSWEVPESLSGDSLFRRYLQIAGKNIKMNLESDALNANEFTYNNKIRISMSVQNNTEIKNLKVIESSGSKSVDQLVLQSIKQTLKYINFPVMTTETGNRAIILAINI